MKGVVRSLVDRAIGICDAEFLDEEFSHITKTLKNNGFPMDLIRSTIPERLNQRSAGHRETRSTVTLTIPYLKGLGGKLVRLGKVLDFRIHFKTAPNMRAILRGDKTVTPLEDKPGVVYAVKCGCGATYIGETGNSIKHRFAEHMRCLQRYLNAKSRAEGELQRHRGRPQILDPSVVMAQCIKASAVAEHATTCPSGLNPEVLCLDNHYKTRKIKEALYIRSNTTINRDNGLEVDDAWNTLVLSLNCCALEQS
uniref:GIY-YIG domain-containing protein n=1 Tax=Trichuris muris TaxID=70415 RepID=A0A5S6PYL7_TRIMR